MDDEIFTAEVFSRQPLADAVWRVFHHVMADSWLDDVWSRNRGSTYERTLKFSTLAHLITDALVQHEGSGRQAFERGQEKAVLPVSINSAYDKLGNLPLSLSEAMLEEGTERLHELLPENPPVDPFPLPACWEGFEVFSIDGKAIKHVKRLLKPLRDVQAGILGARSSVALNVRTGTAAGKVSDLDGEAGEAALSARLLWKMAEAAGLNPWVVILDRLYCNLKFPSLVLAAGGHFIIRYCSNTAFIVDPARPPKESRDAKGRRIVQEWGRLGKSAGDRALYVRRITLYLPDGTVISIITDLLDDEAYPAEDLLATYRERWGIEKVFQQVTDVFSLKHLIGSSPQAVLFQFSLCLLLYNTLQVVRTHLAFHQKCEADKISNEKLFGDVKRQLITVSELVDVSQLLRHLGEGTTSAKLRKHLSRILRGAWSNRWWKSRSSGRGGHKKVKQRVLGNHTSTYRVLQNAKT